MDLSLSVLAPWREQYPNPEFSTSGKFARAAQIFNYSNTKSTKLADILRRRTLEVNTTHHQAVKAIGTGLVVNATAEDGLIEGIESLRHSFVLGVQWHPEVLAPRHVAQRRIFSFFIYSCRRRRRPR